MTLPATFVICRSGRTEVMLGNHLVGVIEPWDGGQIRNGLGAIEAYYWITLPIDGGYSRKFPVSSIDKARRLILHRLSDWFEAAGLLFVPIAEVLAAQAELEREARSA